MYVKDGKRTYRHIFIITFLIWYHLNVMLSMSKMSKIDQIYLRAVMLCMSEMSKMSKIDQIHLRAVAMYVEDVEDRSYTPKGCNAMYVEDVKDRSNTPKGCNAMYVKDGKRTYTHILAHNFRNT